MSLNLLLLLLMCHIIDVAVCNVCMCVTIKYVPLCVVYVDVVFRDMSTVDVAV